jgi:hypothetical protein
VCVPTRGRPGRFAEMLQSAQDTAAGRFEVCAWLDDEDPEADFYPQSPLVRYGSAPRPYRQGRLQTSGLWSKAWELATGDIAMLCGDDVLFRTPGWDVEVEAAFEAVPDGILMVYCHDGTSNPRPVLPFVSRSWIEAVGYFTPPDFQGWFSDTWIWVMAAELRRVRFLSRVLIEHAHRPGSDQTYLDGEAARAAEGGRQAMRSRFYEPKNVKRRAVQVARLRAAMTSPQSLHPRQVPRWMSESLARI